MSKSRSLEQGDIVDIKAKSAAKVRAGGFQFQGDAQFMVADISPRDKWSWGKALLLRKPGDSHEHGHWLWTKDLHRVAGKNIRIEWEAFVARAKAGKAA